MANKNKKKPGSKSHSDVQDLLDPLSSTMKSAFLRKTRGAQGDETPRKTTTTQPIPKKEKDESASISPLAPDEFPVLAGVGGVGIAVAQTGEKYKGRDDLLMVQLDPNTSVAGVFTKSATAAAPVEWCKDLISAGQGKARALIVNAGNANAFTGKGGRQAVKAVAAGFAKIHGCRQKDVFVASTGVIGEPLNTDLILKKIDGKSKPSSPRQWERAANAIRTTDTFGKGAYRQTEIAGVPVKIAGIAKGSGMIAPDMATMLGFIFTDASLSPEVLQTLLQFGVRDSFNAITVDSDMSTSDTVLAFATGAQAQQAKISRAGDPRLKEFRSCLLEVMQELAQLIVRDGEGASKFVTVDVHGAATQKSARTVALAIANSPLVKTAIAGEDANWGRVVMAVGKAGEVADRDKLSISFGPHLVAKNGQRALEHDEPVLSRYMKNDEVEIRVDLRIGNGQARIWTCDLTHGYISINADYRS